MENEEFLIASVILEQGFDKELDYRIPKECLEKIEPGMMVEVPLRTFMQKGVVLQIKKTSDFSKNLKSIHRLLEDEEKIPEKLFQLLIWTANYYGASFTKVLGSILPKSIRKKVVAKPEIFIESKKSKKELLELLQFFLTKKTKTSQAKILEVFLQNDHPLPIFELQKLAGVSLSPIQTLVEKKILEKKIACQDPFEKVSYIPSIPKVLSEEQTICFEKIESDVRKKIFQVHLIYGVTGSGKTEIYLQLIAKALKENKSAIICVPEIALTPQTIEKFKSRFPCETLAIFHHKRSDSEKYEAWSNVLKNKAKIVIGARSAIFAPVENLGVIIIDEEHDTSYKQTEKSPTIHARHIAIMRGKMQSCPVILGSATPSFESFYLARQHQYVLHTLRYRPKNTSLPKISIVDMRKEKHALFSDALLKAIETRISKGEQTILFLNRRGFHTHLLCLSCSKIVKCQHCDVSLTFHKKESFLLCHSCGYSIPPPKKCPYCQEEGFFKYKGYGTEMVESALHAIFPHIKTMRIDRDTTKTKHGHEELLKKFRAGKADVLIGTQMIAKGLHFPAVTLVGVLNCDAGLTIPDFRSSEYVFQKIVQVAGRAGREDTGGEVFLQTYLPNHPTICFAKEANFEKFFDEEIVNRQLFNYPPFTKMVKFLFSGDEEKTTFEAAENFQKKLIEIVPPEVEIHSVTPSGKTKTQDLYHFHFLVRSKKPLGSLLHKIKSSCPLPTSKNIHLLIDVDPVFTFF